MTAMAYGDVEFGVPYFMIPQVIQKNRRLTDEEIIAFRQNEMREARRRQFPQAQEDPLSGNALEIACGD